MNKIEWIQKLREEENLPSEGYEQLLRSPWSGEEEEFLYTNAREVRIKNYGHSIYMRGLIEFTNYCRNDCYYCGIRKSNCHITRYRLTKEEILACCEQGYRIGYRTFVLQGGEDGYFTDERICDIVGEIRHRYPDCAITLSIGERAKESYQAFFDAGANRYLLRQETSNSFHYGKLHPHTMSMEHRQQCLRDLKEIGFQTGCGIMVGSPEQKTEYIVEDLMFMKELNPHMIGIGPFIPHQDTCFASEPAGTLEDTLHLLGILRLMFPRVLLPATTALGSIHPRGREMGVLAGANIVMPNISPLEVREKYRLYDGKIGIGEEAVRSYQNLCRRMEAIGYEVQMGRGDYPRNSDEK
ncbi:MAG: [FeFe] hydrogenase H-cluster radical SAM maturase HydE [Clostridiales bacterium]|nr:[FeFe] hydrogenase H-cluster radical SAM maturase HydE [Clostridiales bacterium]